MTLQKGLDLPCGARLSHVPSSSASPMSSPVNSPKSDVQRLQGRSALTVSFLLLLLELLAGQGKLFAQQQNDPGWSQDGPYSSSQYAPEPQSGYEQTQGPAQPLGAGQLEQLVAPIALYPDSLVAQVLAASTYPSQVSDADRWRQTQGNTPAELVADGADVQNWDPSVKALTAFPQVLAQMDRNLQWTTDLGNAYYNQPQDVLEAVQVMRRRAQAAGTLQSTPQLSVQYNQGYVQLMPVNPQIVYVPTYNPWTVYGDQVSPYPGFSLLGLVGSFLGASPLHFGLGVAMSAFAHTPWGWLAWGLNWLVQSVFFHDSAYFSHSSTVADWGFRHEGFHAYAGRGGFDRRGFNRVNEGFHRFGDGYRGNRGEGFGRAPDRYAGNWRGNSDRGFRSFGGGYDRTAHQAYNHMSGSESRQQFDRRGYSSFSNRSTEWNRAGVGMPQGRSMPEYRASNSGFDRNGFGGRTSNFASRGFTNKDFSHSIEKSSHSGGLHLFGGGHASKSFSGRNSGSFHRGGGGHAQKSFHASSKSFGGGHSHGGGGHSSGHGGGKHHG